MIEDQLLRRFNTLTLDEPPPARTTEDILAQGRRRLGRHRIATAAATTVSLSAVGVAAAAIAMSQVTTPQPVQPGIAAPATEAPELPEDSPTTEFMFPATRQLLYDVALEHFDPAGDRLAFTSNGGRQGLDATAGWTYISNKLDWTNPGERGLGLVEVVVATGPDVVPEIAIRFGCADFPIDCPAAQIPGTDLTAYVAEPKADDNLQFAVIHERADGTVTAVAVYDLFAQNSTEPVSRVDIGVEQGLAFVTDERLRVDSDEHEQGLAELRAMAP